MKSEEKNKDKEVNFVEDESIEDKSIEPEAITEQNELDECKQKQEEYISLLKRAQADFINYKSRVLKETDNFVFEEQKIIINEFILFRETLNRAYTSETNELVKSHIKELLNNFDNILTRLDIKQLNLDKKDFDYNFCECCGKKVVNENEVNKIIDIIENGYLYQNKLIKPAKVIVGIKEEWLCHKK